ncbi:hypothetical protein SLH46_14720 [Draconibacterium sp. IB214405]|uniref:hypothetical protein n=1 Tax=Draconibacterium sp. IB214405 TaxID=3097352 RepID=UPI002A0B4434|nr:hypothetical protein [Draconibacterium sp. IB214405]MDX8340453.1 hypothetical protein [Draconibacterium sp. IB214405]
MRWIFYIVCFLLLGINSASEATISSQQTTNTTVAAQPIEFYYSTSPVVFISEDLDSDGFTLGSGLLVSDTLASSFSEYENCTVQFKPATYSYLLSVWLIDLPPPSLV